MDESLRQKLPELQKKLDDAETELHDALVKLYPEGAVLQVRLSSRKVQPTEGTVISHGFGSCAGYVGLRLHTERKPVRGIFWKDIVC
jgi:hypothetical protein